MATFMGERTILVAAMAVILGGSLGLAIASSAPTGRAWLGSAARLYEWAFWIAVSVIVVTGLANVAALGQALPSPEGGWRSFFQVKLLVVCLLLALSFGRTLLVTLDANPRLLTRSFGATAVLGTLVMITAVGLAHG